MLDLNMTKQNAEYQAWILWNPTSFLSNSVLDIEPSVFQASA